MNVNNQVIQKLAIKLANLEITNAEILSKYELLVNENKELMKQIETLTVSNVEEEKINI